MGRNRNRDADDQAGNGGDAAAAVDEAEPVKEIGPTGAAADVAAVLGNNCPTCGAPKWAHDASRAAPKV